MRPQKTNLFATKKQGKMMLTVILSCLFSVCGNVKLYSGHDFFLPSKTKNNFRISSEEKILLDENNLQCNTPIPVTTGNFSTLTSHINDNVFSVVPLCLGNVSNISNLIDNNLNNFTNINITGIGCNATIGARNNSGISFPGGTWAGFRISSNSLLDVSVAATVTISTYNNNTFRESFVVSSSLIGIDSDLLNNDGTYNAGFLTTQSFNEIRITYSSLVGVLFSAQIYHPIVMNFCSANPPACNTTNKLILPDYPVTVTGVNTGINALACALCDVSDAYKVIDSLEDNYATINLTVGVAASGSISVKNVIDNFDVETYAGFDIENIDLLDIGVLDAITVSTYNNGVLQESKSGQGNLILTNTSLITDNGRRMVGFLPIIAYDEIKLTVTNLVGIELGTVKVYGAVYEFFCNGPLECNQTYPLTKPERPVFINSERTGVQGIASIGCSVAESFELLDNDTTDYATITMAVSALSTGSISVKSAYQVYPEGSKTGFAIRDMNTFIQADVFESITVCTYLDDVVSECKSGGDLLDVSLLSNIIGSGSGVYNIGFRTTLPYDEVTIEVGSLVSALNIIRVYGAFVDTRGSFGDILDCCVSAPPVTGDTVCVGDIIDLDQIVDGLWSTTNGIIALVNNLGQAQTMSSGVVSLANIDTISGCVNNSIVDVTVAPRPIINLLGNDTICVGSTTLIDNLSGGILSGTDNALINITGNNLITGLNGGTVNLYLLDNITGCVSDSSTAIVVIDLPVIDFGGTDSICEGGILDLNILNGNYTSSNPLIASVDVNGILSANIAGSIDLTLTDGNGCVSLPSVLEILPRPVINILGNDTICVGSTTLIDNLAGGILSGTDNALINITGNNLITGLNGGTVNLYLLDNITGCISDTSTEIVIIDLPVIDLGGTDSICEGGILDLGLLNGNYTSSNPLVASVDVNGILTANVTGSIDLTLTDDNGCLSLPSVLEILPRPVINILGNDTICVGSTSLIDNLAGGILSGTDNALINITGNNLITGLNGGTVNLYLLDNITGCVSDTSTEIVIIDLPVIDLGGTESICEGGILDLGLLNGNYTSSNPLVASVDVNGIITANASGLVSFTYSDAFGCTSLPTSILQVLPRATILLTGDDNICEGETTSLISTDIGIWVSSDTTIATVNNLGIVNAIGSGSITISLINDNLCVSLPSEIITINPTPTVVNLGHDSLCIGEGTILSATAIGTWLSSNASIATITNGGIVSAYASGQVSFLFTENNAGCVADTIITITVNPNPVINVLGDAELCIGATLNLAASGGLGLWALSDTTIASIDANGVLTGLSPGDVSIGFTNLLTGCSAIISPEIMIFGKPSVAITGDLSICIGSTTTLSPLLSGIWKATDSLVVSVDASGVVTGLSEGTSAFTFTENATGCVSDTTVSITVMVGADVAITGDTFLCIGELSQLISNKNGTWTSSNPLIASVNNLGVVTALNGGQVQFTFTSDSGCVSNPTSIINIHHKPVTTVAGNINLCLGQTINVNPNVNGTWISTKPLIASITNGGLITALNPGRARFIYTDLNTGCVSDSNIQIIVNAPPVVVLLGSSQLCIGQQSQVSPTTQGIWISSNPAVVSVTNSGLITAFTPGISNLTFISSTTGCSSNGITITVNPKPVIQIEGDIEICVNATTNLSPSLGGIWYSNNPAVATIDNNGIVTGVSQGAVKFYFISNITGCQSNLSATVTVNSKPYVNVIGPIEICAGTTTQLLPTLGGIWSSLDVNIATVDNNGVVVGIESGVTSFEFTDTSTNCTSTLIDVEVNANDPIHLSGSRDVCIGYNTSLFPLSGGIFVSSDASIATVDNSGIIRARAEGKVSFGFIHSITGCISKMAGDSVEVFNCFDPDFNASLVNVTVNGNLSTNDEPLSSAFYTNNHFIVSKPNSSVSNLQVNLDGSYNFTANKPGEYIYQVPICLGQQMPGCPTSNLKITVLEPKAVTDKVIANTDIISVYAGRNVTINTTANDACVNIPDCNIDHASVAIIAGPYHGAAIPTNVGQIQYVPLTNFYGLDTITYRVCSNVDNLSCKTAIQIINVKSNAASNSTVAYDDFYAVYGSMLVQGNVLSNDSDAEGDNIHIIAQGDKLNKIEIPQGTYFILNDGEFEFLPQKGFKGTVDLIYTMCDDNTESACVKATIHVLVLGEMTIQVRAYLEGALINNGNSVASTGRPLMRDNLRLSNFTGQRHIPSYDPYKFFTDFTIPSAQYGHVGNYEEFDSIPTSSRIFEETGENAIVDWVYLELRDKNDDAHIFVTRSALLQRDGDVVDLDGVSAVRFPGILLDSFYVVLRHRNHLGVMSQLVSIDNLIDFTSPQTSVFNFGIKNGYNYAGLSLNSNVKEGYKALWAGDANGDGKIKFHGTNDDVNYYFADVLGFPTNFNANSNFDFSYGYFSGDYNMDGKSKFDNPFDDKNNLFATILFYPLNENYLSNFDHFIEQIPAMRAEHRPN